MNQIDILASNYRKFVDIPWQRNPADSQRIWFAIYPPSEERRVREHISDFQCATLEAQHGWVVTDIVDSFDQWLADNEYREAYFEDPPSLSTASDSEFSDYLSEKLRGVCLSENVNEDTVVAILGTSGLFGFSHLSKILSAVESSIRGRLLVFFPGEHDKNRYRFMNARDGFNYMAVPITCTERVD